MTSPVAQGADSAARQAARWRVHKFGGSSVADAACFRRVADILEADAAAHLGVVLSACKGVTDALLGLVGLAEARDAAVDGALEALQRRHAGIARELLSAPEAAAYEQGLAKDIRDLAGLLQAVSLLRRAGKDIRDLVAGYGEIWSTRLFSRFLCERARRPGEVRWVDARDVVVVEWSALGPAVQWEDSQRRMDTLVAAAGGAPTTFVITGFIASDPRGIQTTLGRNGSDFSGSIFGALLAASEIIIWTDVDGVLSADPRKVPDAQVIDSLSYNEAMELAYFGAKVIHPQTMAPAVAREIPIWIRNTFAPGKPGTVICAQPTSTLAVKGITSIEDVSLVNLEGAGMIGVPGTAQRLFGALRDAQISVILISQGSSEHSICFAIPATQAVVAEQAVRRAFDAELREGQIQQVEVTPGCAILAVVGDGMAGTHGVAAKVCSALGDAAVNIRAIAQGASERNISFVIDGRHSARALRAVHSGFYLSPNTISIGLIGPGVVGRVLLEQIASQLATLRGEANVDLRVRGIASSKKMLLVDGEVDLAHWREEFDRGAVPLDLDAFEKHIHADHLPHAIMLDCTASADVAARYERWLGAGIHVVTPNKKANSAALLAFRAMHAARRQAGSHYLYEATVGAGLPVIQTLRDLRQTGDTLRSIEGIFSGTLAYLFNVFDGSRPFSEIVADAKGRGYTEPDPRDDLSGMDVARKLTILAREAGLEIEMAEVEVESLVPASLQAGSSADFMAGLPAFDGEMARRLAEAQAAGEVLRYVARLDMNTRRATVKLVRLPGSHAFAHMALTDNIVRYETARYCENPLIVQGPGAGPEVTAGGVFGDLLRCAAFLGAKL
ncbi:MAG: bifunctional aspartate kinase/homoserine dehydrogenase I [Gammaproteobacteria bacterium]